VTTAIERLFGEEKRMALVAGPRQVGKTTLAKSLLEKVEVSSNYFNWDSDTHRRAILKTPESFWMTAGGGHGPSGRIRVCSPG
jgi:predicted AAA+ superfamily ATPase